MRLVTLLTVACAPAAPAMSATTSLPDGVYRKTLTRQDILGAVPSASEELVRSRRLLEPEAPGEDRMI